MAQHAAFRIASCTTSVDQAAGSARFLSCHLCQDDFVLDGKSSLNEIFPEEEARAGYVGRKAWLTPENESFDSVILVEVHSEALQMLGTLAYDDFCLSMVSLVEASVCLVRDVDTRVDLIVHDAANESDGPLGRVEAHDGDGGASRAAQLVASLGKAERIVPVLVPGPAKFGIVALNPKSGSIASALHCIGEHLAESEGHFGAGAALAHLDGELILDVAAPVEALAAVRVDQLVVPVGRHHHNAIVCHFVACSLSLLF